MRRRPDRIDYVRINIFLLFLKLARRVWRSVKNVTKFSIQKIIKPQANPFDTRGKYIRERKIRGREETENYDVKMKAVLLIRGEQCRGRKKKKDN